MLISMRPTIGSFLPRIFATSSLVGGIVAVGKRLVAVIRDWPRARSAAPRRHDFSRYGPVPTGLAIAQPLASRVRLDHLARDETFPGNDPADKALVAKMRA